MTKRPKGHPPFVPTDANRHSVMQMAGMGVPQDMIAKAIWNEMTGKAIGESTLKLHFHEELQCGKARVMSKFCNALYQKGIVDGDMRAIELYFAVQMGWNKTTNHNHNLSAKNSDGGEVVIEVKFGKGQQQQDERLAALEARRKGNGAEAIH